jgi:hypothetical protein
MNIADQDGRPVPHIKVRTDNGIVCYTNYKGDVTWTEPSLMNRSVTFAIETPGYRLPNARVFVASGNHANIKTLHGTPAN